MANAVASMLGERVDRGTLPFAVGDVLVIAALITVGVINHNSVEFVTSNPTYVLGTIAPFVVAWVVVSPFVGAYSVGAGESAKASVPLVVRSWVLAGLLGVALRATPVFHGGFDVIFALVILVVVGTGLALWRAAVFAVR